LFLWVSSHDSKQYFDATHALERLTLLLLAHTLLEMWNTCYRKHTCTDREEKKTEETQANQRFPKERAG